MYSTQNSLSRRLKRLSLTRHSSNGKRNDSSHAYSFVKMHGPKMKGFAEMAVAKSSHELLPPQPAPRATEPPTISPRLVVSAKHSSQVAQIPVPTVRIAEEKSSRSATTTPIHIRASSSPAPMPYHERSYSSPIETASSAGSRGDSSSSPSRSSVMEGEDFRRRSRPGSTVLTRQGSQDSFSSNELVLNGRHEHSQSFSEPVRDNDTISVASSTSTASTASAGGNGIALLLVGL